MTSFFSRLSPVPGFPSYTGPYQVGSIDVELPVSELESPSPSPDDRIPTVQYRVFYPCERDAKGKPVHWIPSPQRGYMSAYTRFLGTNSILAEFISYFPRLLYYISIPVLENAPLLRPTTSDGRWPVMIFSHGLGGSRNTYSHLMGSIASHGVVVFAPEHRDGSAPISYIRDVPSTNCPDERSVAAKARRIMDYNRISHTPTPEVEAGRNAQLEIRLWELGLIHSSILNIDVGQHLTNLNTSSAPLAMFSKLMAVHDPGKITFAGHSFGAAAVAQFVKSTFYGSLNGKAPKEYKPLFMPASRSPIVQQITPNTPVILLDLWCLPLRAKSTRWLWDKPFPCYTEGGPGGDSLLAMGSQVFYKWRVHINTTKKFVSPNPSADTHSYDKSDGTEWARPHFYYVSDSAHLSQSDFGVLFPWFTRRVLAALEPERVLRLNVRAALQLMRSRNIEVHETSAADMELDGPEVTDAKGDLKILSTKGEIRGWNWLVTDGQDPTEDQVNHSVNAAERKEDGLKSSVEEVVGNELLKEPTTGKSLL